MNLVNVKNPNFWSALSVLVATIALILTQFPPIPQVIRGTSVKITVSETIDLWHDLGNIGLSAFLDIQNDGGKTVNIDRIECVILEKDTGNIFTFPVRTYQGGQLDSSLGAISLRSVNFSLGTITLEPDQHWSAYVNCYDFFTRSELEQVNNIKIQIQSDVAEKLDQLPADERETAWVEIDDQLYQEAVDFFNKKFELTNEGNYQLFIRAVSDSGYTLRLLGFDFTLFKSNIQTLQSLTEKDYKFGSGIIYRTRYAPSEVTIPVEQMDEMEARATYQQKIEYP